MSKGFDYSKWDNIELSDDEDDVHPNIDRESWFRMKHRSRVEREEREEADKKKIRREMAKADLRIRELTKLLGKINSTNDGDDSDDDDLEDKEGIEAELSELRKANKARQDKLDEYEKNKKWNVDNMCHVVEERTVINPKAAENKFSSAGYALPDDNAIETPPSKGISQTDDRKPSVETASIGGGSEGTKATVGDEPQGEKQQAAAKEVKGGGKGKKAAAPSKAAKPKKAGPEREVVAMMSYHEFTEKYADLVEEFMAIKSFDKCRDFLIQNGNVLLQENASNYLLLASLEDEMNGYRDKMRQTARQSQIVSNIAELAKTLQSHPGNVIIPFFKRLEEKEHLNGFLEGVEVFVQRIIARAVVKKKEMDAERIEEAKAKGEAVDLSEIPREERLGPGGLDPMEVFESLPESMQEAFESRDTEKLKEALMAMDPSDAEHHMKRCVDSGLWNE